MTANTKRLVALYQLPDGNIHKYTLKEGHTADFAQALGFVIEDIDIQQNESSEAKVSASMDFLGLNGTYPVLFAGNVKKLEGRLLTLCDLTFNDASQREAFKSLVRENVWELMDRGIEFTEHGYYSTK